MDEKALKEISRLCEAATPGPWKTWPDGTEESVESESLGRFVCHLNSNMRDYREDSAFIAASRTLVPALVSALRESQAEVARLREAVAGWRHARVADDGMACWCLTEHAHRKYGCDDMRAALGQPGQPSPAE